MKPTVASYCTTFLKPEMRHIYRQVSALEHWQTVIVCKERQSEAMYPMDEIDVVPPVRSNFIRRFWLKYILREPPIVYRGEYRALEHILQQRRAEVMHVYFGHTGVHLLPFIRRWSQPTLVSFHGMDVQTRADRPGYESQLRELLQTVPLVLVRSESLRERVQALGCPEEKIRLNRTGIPLEAFPLRQRPRPADGAWHFVQACRLIEKKGLDVTLRAFASFYQKYPQSRLTIAGEGPLLSSLQQLVGELSLGSAVTLAGFLAQDELRALYHEAHAFVHPSQLTADQNQEGIPNSMLEAMATGLPVLATYHGGIPEAVDHDRTGLLVPERDLSGLTASFFRLTEADGLWESLSAAAAQDVRERFEHRTQIARLESCYDELKSLTPRWQEGLRS
jgi:colanic acid/amylovoran biosynthesis glycosyltransferase